ncbi:hypothetical protein CYMTET_45697 [Cymbomonas tetramitiformis]|uniref:DUF547 domain-containing protein n=1 Tax=Cymbomonas tetramitiformis TaxID=36881 RepID=A0AAE0EXT5_9CHLO|nr:hypothetical protein CYMTET_45697 [Cymbomonas tetramitiformis]
MRPVILNTESVWSSPARAPLEVAKTLQKTLLKLQGKFLAEDGSGVDYQGLLKSSEFQEYKQMTGELREVDLTTLSEIPERRCFFINLYNALTVHAICASFEERPIKSVLDIKDFWKTMSYQIGAFVFSLDAMEHGILRGNRPHPSTRKSFFQEDDPRLSLGVPLDCRVHFALVCGAVSCPSIRVFQQTNLEKGLQGAATSFCDGEVEVDTSCVKMSKIFDWYSKDFGSTQIEVLETIVSFMSPGQQRDQLNQLVQDGRGKRSHLTQGWRWFLRPLFGLQTMLPGPVYVRFKSYDWSLNHS